MTTIAEGHEDSGTPTGHEHPKFLAHHFDTPQQQFDSGKLGIWLFLTTEILLFSGLFCAYSVYRANHPEVFEYAHQYLNKWLGALNTLILIFSSFTMAWGVRAAQMGARRLCVTLLGITIVCGAGFMCVKGVEYNTKFKEALYPGYYYNPTERPGEVASLAKTGQKPVPVEEPAAASDKLTPAPPLGHSASGVVFEESKVARAAVGPQGLNPVWVASESSRSESGRSELVLGHEVGNEPRNVQIFFSIYFLMTGLHGLHVLVGMSLIFWVMMRARRGDFSADYYSPVDFVGLYWHVVDLIWIFLFPLLYLIS